MLISAERGPPLRAEWNGIAEQLSFPFTITDAILIPGARYADGRVQIETYR